MGGYEIKDLRFCRSAGKIVIVFWYGGVAQLGERLNGIQEVMGSTPTVSTLKNSEKSKVLSGFRYFL